MADFVKVTWKQGEDGEPERVVTPTRPPADVPPDILTQTELPFPRLEEILHAPVFLPDGTLLAEDGYNPEHAYAIFPPASTIHRSPFTVELLIRPPIK